MSMQKALIYCRVSDTKQATEGDGLGSQETRCRRWAEANDYAVEMVFPDTISGGGDFMKRPGMVALLAYLDAQPGEQFTIIFDDPKRFARSTRYHLDLREALRVRGVTIKCLNFRFDDTPEGEFFETIVAAHGQLERKQNGRQTAQKMEARMQNGYWVHNAPVGYIYREIKGRGKLLFPDAPLDAVVKEAFEGYASGRFQTVAEVVRFFETIPNFPRSKRTGKITQQRVVDVLTHPLYTGHICSEHYGISWVKAQHEPLISLETFEKVLARREGKAYAPRRKNLGNEFVLRGVVACACCDVPFRSSFTRGNGGLYAYYLCQTKGCEAYGKSIKRDTLERDVGDIIKTLEPTENLKTIAAAMFKHIWDTRRAQAEAIKSEAKKKLREMDKRVETLLGHIMNAQSTAVVPVYEGEIVALERGKAVLAEQMQKQTEPKGSFEEKLEPALLFLSNPWKLWETGHVSLRRVVLKLAFTDHLKYCRNEGARTPKIAFPFKALDAFSTSFLRNGARGRGPPSYENQ